mgnify:FL=1
MKNKLFGFGLILLVLATNACQKDVSITPVPERYQKLEKVATLGGLKQMLHHASGAIGITNLKPFGPESLLSGGGPSEVFASFSAEEGRATFGALMIQNTILTPSTYDYYQSGAEERATIQGYFGATQSVKLLDVEGASEAAILVEDIYLPKELFVHDPIERGRDYLAKTSTIHWNPDPHNTNGVFILIDFLPEGEENAGRFNSDFVSHRKLIYTEDDGEYQLQVTDFNKIPDGAYVSLLVGRGDYVETTGSNGRTYLVYSLTGATAWFQVMGNDALDGAQ